MNVTRERAALERMTVGELQERYAQLTGEPARSRHRAYLVRRVLWRLQAKAEGGLSERALRRAEELANDADVRVTPPRAGTGAERRERPASDAVRVPVATDPRLPRPGTAITRKYKGRTITVNVLADGFEYAGEKHRSLSAVAKAISGQHVNGFRFFRLEARP